MVLPGLQQEELSMTKPSAKVEAEFSHYRRTGEVPDFPERGKYQIWDKSWNRVGLADAPQYSGQQPFKYPLDWPAGYCQ